MPRLAAVLTCLLVAFAAPAAAFEDRYDFSGTYAVYGENPDGNGVYEGQANIYMTGATYRVEWYVGSDTFVGTGIGYGDMLAVGYDGGTALYQQQKDGTLTGVWTVNQGYTLGTEVLAPILGE